LKPQSQARGRQDRLAGVPIDIGLQHGLRDLKCNGLLQVGEAELEHLLSLGRVAPAGVADLGLGQVLEEPRAFLGRVLDPQALVGYEEPSRAHQAPREKALARSLAELARLTAPQPGQSPWRKWVEVLR